MKRSGNIFIVLIAVFVIVGIFIVQYLFSVMDISYVNVRWGGRELFNLIDGKNAEEALWPTSSLGMSYTNSTDYFNELAERLGVCSNYLSKVYSIGSEVAKVSSPQMTGLNAENNLWTVVNNLPSNAPANVIVLATRNVDPSSLRTKLEHADMDKRITFNTEGEAGVLRHTAVIIRKDGSSLAITIRKRASRYGIDTLRYVYGDKPFDLTKNTSAEAQVSYLTPNKVIIVKNQ